MKLMRAAAVELAMKLRDVTFRALPNGSLVSNSGDRRDQLSADAAVEDTLQAGAHM